MLQTQAKKNVFRFDARTERDFELLRQVGLIDVACRDVLLDALYRREIFVACKVRYGIVPRK